MSLQDAADSLDDLAAGKHSEQSRVLAGALALDTFCQTNSVDRDLLDAATGLQMIGTGGTLDLDSVGRAQAAAFALRVRSILEAQHPKPPEGTVHGEGRAFAHAQP